MKMNKKFSITLLVAMFSLLIIGFGGTATAEAAGNCIETLLLNVSASESTAFTSCSAFEVEAARYTGLAAFYAADGSATSQPGAYDIEVVRHNNFVAFGNLKADPENEATSSTLLANNPELAVARRYAALAMENEGSQPGAYDIEVVRHNNFVAFGNLKADIENEVGQPETYGKEDLRQRIYSDWVIEAEAVDVSILGQPTQGNVTSQPVSVDIEIRNHNYYDNLWTARHGPGR